MIAQDELLQEWVNDFVDLYNRYPSQLTIQEWKIQIAITYCNLYDDEDYQ